MRRSRWGWLAEVCLVLVATALVSEVLIRVVNPTPRVQITRSQRPGVPGWNFTMLRDQPTWRDANSDARRNEACPHEGSVDVVIMGTSISFGTGLLPDEPFPHLMQQRLDAEQPGRWCVLNLAQPGYVGANKLAELPDALERFHPAVVLWEVWGNDPDSYTMVGPDAFAFRDLVVGADGYPAVLPLPRALHGWLFEHARVYQYGTLALASRQEDGQGAWQRWERDRMSVVERLVAASGAKLALYAPTPLYKPLDEMADHPDLAQAASARWAASHHVPHFSFAESLRGSDPDDIALHHDGHLNALGHQRVAGPMAEWLAHDVLPLTTQAVVSP